MANEKMTNAKALTYAIENGDFPAEVTDKLTKMLEQVNKKSGSAHKPTAVQIANEGYKALIMEVVSSSPMTCTAIQKSIPDFAEFSNQKVTALVKALVDEHRLVKTIEKGRSYFAIAE